MLKTIRPSVVLLLSLLVVPLPTLAQKNAVKKKQPAQPPVSELSEAQLPAFAISLVISLATDARSYTDLALRPRVLAQAGDVLWEADNVTARALFKRAWDEAEKGDADEVTIKTKDKPPAMVIGLRRMSGRDLRFEVLSVIARRDQALFDELFAKLKTEDGEKQQSKGNATSDDGWLVSEAVAKRLQVARALLRDGQTQKALEFAAPALTQVNVHSIGFLSELRIRSAAAADQSFARLLTQAEFDPAADANTVSGLSSYLFTPGLYLSFSPEGGTRWTQPDAPPVPPADISAALRDRFFQVAAKILLRPSPPAGQDFSSSGPNGKLNVIRRLLPLFEQHAPDSAAALRAHVIELSGNSSRNMISPDNSLLAQGIQAEPSTSDTLDQMQRRLDRATTSRERDTIYAAAVGALLAQGDERARDLADKIEDRDRRQQLRQLVDLEFVQRAIQKKSSADIVRIIQLGQLTPAQRSFAYAEAARLSLDSQAQREGLDFLEKAIQDAQRVEIGKPDRALLLTGIVNQLIRADRIRAWEIMSEVVKAANTSEEYKGDDLLHYPLMTRSGMKVINIGGENFKLSKVFEVLAKDDLYRAIELVKSFKYDPPRASATLTIASTILKKKPATQTAQQD
jgi:hypothetical protein